MNIGYLCDESGTIEDFIRGCSEIERMRMFKQYCYDRRVIADDPTANIANKHKLPEIGAVFRKMGYKDCF